ncbi:MAG: hypothetical protein AAB600_05445 [Patescibacteria group bacterium]
MNTTTIHVKIDTKTKIEAKKVAEEPTDYFKQLMREADEDVKAGRVVSFKNGREALGYLDSLIKDDKKNKRPAH